MVLDAELLRIQVQKRRQQGSVSESPTENGGSLLSDDEISREALIKEHYMARIGQLSEQLHYTDGRAVAFYEECKALALKVWQGGGRVGCVTPFCPRRCSSLCCNLLSVTGPLAPVRSSKHCAAIASSRQRAFVRRAKSVSTSSGAPQHAPTSWRRSSAR